MITAQDIAWAAGVYEGEGSAVKPTRKHRTQAVQLTQKDGWLAYQMKELFGGYVYYYDYPPQREGGPRRTYYHWKLAGPGARGFLMTIYKFLSPRRKQQIREALAERTDLTRKSPLSRRERPVVDGSLPVLPSVR